MKNGNEVRADAWFAGQSAPAVAAAVRWAPAIGVPALGDERTPRESQRLQVLVVEDDPDGAEAVADLLRSWGHAVDVVADGETALERVATLDPDVVLLDIGLPGMSGWEVAHALPVRGVPPRPLVLVLSAFSPDRDRAAAAGVFWYFVKPAGLVDLQGVLDAYRRTLPPRRR